MNRDPKREKKFGFLRILKDILIKSNNGKYFWAFKTILYYTTSNGKNIHWSGSNWRYVNVFQLYVALISPFLMVWGLLLFLFSIMFELFDDIVFPCVFFLNLNHNIFRVFMCACVCALCIQNIGIYFSFSLLDFVDNSKCNGSRFNTGSRHHIAVA